MSTNPPTIAMVTHRFVRGDGQGRVNYETARALLAAGFRLELVASDCASDLINHPRVSWHRVVVRGLPSELLRNQLFAWRSARILRRLRCSTNLVHANGFITWAKSEVNTAHFVHGGWLHSRAYPYRWTQGLYAAYQRLYTTLNAVLERRAFAAAQVVVAVSSSVAGELLGIGVAKARIRVIFNGVDADEFHPGFADRSAWGLPPEVSLFLFAGDLRTTRKGLDTVLQALTQLPDCHLAVAGELGHSPFPQMVREMGLVARVHFLGKVAMADLMRAVDAFVLVSRYEPMGLVVLEAMASGLPVITSKNVGAAELLGASGLVIEDPNDVTALVAAMRRLAEDSALCQRLGAAGRNIAERYTWQAMSERYLDLYAEVSGQAEADLVTSTDRPVRTERY